MGHIHFHDLGYRFKKRLWGKGYATESSRAVLEYGFNTLDAAKIMAMTDPRHDRSKCVLAKLGFTFQGTFDYDGDPIHWFELTKTAWENRS